MRTKQEIMDLIAEEDVEFIRLQFTDMCGNLKNVAVTANQIEKVLDNRFVFDGSAIFGTYFGEEEDVYLSPDLDTFVILPWRPQQGKVARLLCDIKKSDGHSFEISPRTILKRVIKSATEKGYTFKIDPECEFFLFNTDENGAPTTITYEQAGYMDVGPLDLGENARRDIVLNLEEMGFDVESSHHEKAPAQHEIDFREAEPLQIADSIITLKSAVRSTAARFGLHATFMPKPKQGIAGSGMHLNLTVYNDGNNIFRAIEKDKELSNEAKWFMGGIMEHIYGICAITNPLVNSYKRLMSAMNSPKDIVWSKRNINSLLRVWKILGEDAKVELRFPDPAANPYLAIAVCIAAGIEGIEQKIEPGISAPECYESDNNIKKLPATLREAISSLQEDSFLKEVLGEDFINIYSELKLNEWDEYMEQVSNWEIEKYLNRI